MVNSIDVYMFVHCLYDCMWVVLWGSRFWCVWSRDVWYWLFSYVWM